MKGHEVSVFGVSVRFLASASLFEAGASAVVFAAASGDLRVGNVGFGADAKLQSAATQSQCDAWRNNFGPIEPGSCAVTTTAAENNNSNNNNNNNNNDNDATVLIIHTVVPSFDAAAPKRSSLLLVAAFVGALDAAAQLGVDSVALPGFLLGWDTEYVARLVCETVLAWTASNNVRRNSSSVKRIAVVATTRDGLRWYGLQMARLLKRAVADASSGDIVNADAVLRDAANCDRLFPAKNGGPEQACKSDSCEARHVNLKPCKDGMECRNRHTWCHFLHVKKDLPQSVTQRYGARAKAHQHHDTQTAKSGGGGGGGGKGGGSFGSGGGSGGSSNAAASTPAAKQGSPPGGRSGMPTDTSGGGSSGGDKSPAKKSAPPSARAPTASSPDHPQKTAAGAATDNTSTNTPAKPKGRSPSPSPSSSPSASASTSTSTSTNTSTSSVHTGAKKPPSPTHGVSEGSSGCLSCREAQGLLQVLRADLRHTNEQHAHEKTRLMDMFRRLQETALSLKGELDRSGAELEEQRDRAALLAATVKSNEATLSDLRRELQLRTSELAVAVTRQQAATETRTAVVAAAMEETNVAVQAFKDRISSLEKQLDDMKKEQQQQQQRQSGDGGGDGGTGGERFGVTRPLLPVTMLDEAELSKQLVLLTDDDSQLRHCSYAHGTFRGRQVIVIDQPAAAAGRKSRARVPTEQLASSPNLLRIACHAQIASKDTTNTTTARLVCLTPGGHAQPHVLVPLSRLLQETMTTTTTMSSMSSLSSSSCASSSSATESLCRSSSLLASSRSLRLRVLLDVCYGLEALHEAGLVHGCLGAHTVFVGGDDASHMPAVVGGAGFGPPLPQYTSPEMFDDVHEQHAQPTVRDDLYALGVLMWEVLSWKPSRRSVTDANVIKVQVKMGMCEDEPLEAVTKELAELVTALRSRAAVQAGRAVDLQTVIGVLNKTEKELFG